MSLKTTNAIPIPMYATRLPQAVAPEGPWRRGLVIFHEHYDEEMYRSRPDHMTMKMDLYKIKDYLVASRRTLGRLFGKATFETIEQTSSK